MNKLKSLLKSKKGNSYALTVALLLALFMLLMLVSEYLRLRIIAAGVKDALSAAVVTVATDNLDDSYAALREGYSGGYVLSGDSWQETLDSGDIYAELCELLKLEPVGAGYVRNINGSEEYSITGLTLAVTNADFAPEAAEKHIEITATLDISIPVRFGSNLLPPLQFTVFCKSEFMPLY